MNPYGDIVSGFANREVVWWFAGEDGSHVSEETIQRSILRNVHWVVWQ